MTNNNNNYYYLGNNLVKKKKKTKHTHKHIPESLSAMESVCVPKSLRNVPFEIMPA